MSILKKGLLLVFATFGALSLLELTVRITGLAPETSLISVGRFRISDNPLIGYEPVPNYEYHGTALYFFEFRGKSNSLGYRDREHSLEKPPGVYRIVVIGDSITMGLQIDDHTEDVYTNVLESALTRGGRDVEVINFGVSGYNTQQEVHTLADKGIQFKPDLVILAYCINDTEMMNGGIIDVLHGQAKAGKAIDQNQLIPYLHRSALYRFVHSRLPSKQLTRDWDAVNNSSAPIRSPRALRSYIA
jgi:GDSL-like Lipase/Acylhydrolase family